MRSIEDVFETVQEYETYHWELFELTGRQALRVGFFNHEKDDEPSASLNVLSTQLNRLRPGDYELRARPTARNAKDTGITLHFSVGNIQGSTDTEGLGSLPTQYFPDHSGELAALREEIATMRGEYKQQLQELMHQRELEERDRKLQQLKEELEDARTGNPYMKEAITQLTGLAGAWLQRQQANGGAFNPPTALAGVPQAYNQPSPPDTMPPNTSTQNEQLTDEQQKAIDEQMNTALDTLEDKVGIVRLVQALTKLSEKPAGELSAMLGMLGA